VGDRNEIQAQTTRSSSAIRSTHVPQEAQFSALGGVRKLPSVSAVTKRHDGIGEEADILLKCDDAGNVSFDGANRQLVHQLDLASGRQLHPGKRRN